MENVAKCRQFLHSMSGEEYCEFMRTSEVTNKIVNSWRKFQKKEVKSGAMDETAQSSSSTSSQGSKPVLSVSSSLKKQEMPSSSTSSQERKPVLSVSSSEKPELGQGARGQGRKLESCAQEPVPWQKSAWKTGFIFRGDKVPVNGKLFIDVEKVTLKKTQTVRKHKQVAATICIVNEDGKVILWAFIKIPHEDICQYAPKITNLNERKLGAGVELDLVQTCLDICLKGNQLVGVSLANDLSSLDYSFSNIIDLHDVYRDAKGGFALGHIVQKLMSNRSGFQIGHHSAIDDARSTLAAYKHYVSASTAGTFSADLLRLSTTRDEYKKNKTNYFAEKCKCNM